MTVGEAIRVSRQNAGMTQAELAASIGVQYQAISQWERNIRKPKIETIFRICKALGDDYAKPLRDISISQLSKGEASKVAESIRNVIDASQYALEATQKYKTSVLSSIDTALDLLNDEGQQKARERVEELTEIPRYRRTPQQDTEKPSDAPSEGEGKQ